MSFSDIDQLRYYLRVVRRLESKHYSVKKALEYVIEDNQIADLNHHLTSAAL